jgi:hypothetical protein
VLAPDFAVLVVRASANPRTILPLGYIIHPMTILRSNHEETVIILNNLVGAFSD